jgi:hypothetical protein
MAPPEEAATVPQAAAGTVIRRNRGLLARGRHGLARVPKGGGWLRPVLAGLGALLMVFGVLLRFYAAPRLIAAPPGFNITISLVAPHASYFDEATLTTQRDAALTYNETIRGDPGASTGTTAVWDQFTVLEDLKRNVQLIATFQRSAFNRRTGELTNCCGASVNDDTQVVQGLLTYRFTQRIPVTVVQQMPGVPTSLLGLPGPARNVVADRTFQASNTFWVDPRTGVPVKAEERILSVLQGPGGQGRLMVADADLTMTPDSQRALAAVARQNAAFITTLRQTGPFGGLILGFLLVLAGTVPLRRLPRRARRGLRAGRPPHAG